MLTELSSESKCSCFICSQSLLSSPPSGAKPLLDTATLSSESKCSKCRNAPVSHAHRACSKLAVAAVARRESLSHLLLAAPSLCWTPLHFHFQALKTRESKCSCFTCSQSLLVASPTRAPRAPRFPGGCRGHFIHSNSHQNRNKDPNFEERENFHLFTGRSAAGGSGFDDYGLLV